MEMPIDVAGEDEIAQRPPFTPTAQGLETGVRGRSPVEIEAVAKEPPRLLRVPLKPDGVGDFLEIPAAKGRVGPPETLGAAEVGQPGVDAHARPGTNQEGVGGQDGLGRLPVSIFQVHRTIHVPLDLHPRIEQSLEFCAGLIQINALGLLARYDSVEQTVKHFSRSYGRSYGDNRSFRYWANSLAAAERSKARVASKS